MCVYMCVYTYVVCACANVYSMYMYVYMRVSMYPSPVMWWRGVGGRNPPYHNMGWGGREHETSDHIYTLYCILLYIYHIYIILYIGLYTFRYPPRFYSHSTYFISYLPSPYLTIFLRPQVWCGLRPRLLNRKISSGQGRGTRKKGWCNLMQDGPPQL